MRTLEDLLSQLTSLTETRKLAWVAEGKNSFVARLSQYDIAIWHWVSQNTDIAGINLQLKDADGTVLDAVSADEFGQKYPKLQALFDGARRSAFGIEDVVMSLERELTALRGA